ILDLPGWLVRRQSDAKAHSLAIAASERRQHAFADGDLVAQRVGNSIGIGVIERPVEDDFRKEAGGIGGGGLAEQIERGGVWHSGIVKRGKESVKGWLSWDFFF